MGVNCVRWADRPAKQPCEGWGDDPRPVADFEPEHGLEGCEDWTDKDISLSADVVFVEDESGENQIVTSNDEQTVIKTNPSGRTPV